MAKAGLQADPPEQPPDGLRRVLGFRRLSGAALETVRRALDGDDEFRKRVAAEAAEEDIGRAAWVWLTRSKGWQHELADLTGAAAEQIDGEPAERVAGRLRRALAGAEEAARRREAEAASAREAERRARVDLAAERGGRRAAARELTAAQAAVSAASEDRMALAAKLETAESELGRLRSELGVAREALHQAEQELLAIRAGERSPASSGQADPDVTRRLMAAAGAAAELSRSLTQAVEAAGAAGAAGAPEPMRGSDSQPPSHARPTGEVRSGRAVPSRDRTKRRRPAPMPPGVWDDSPEAAAHLARMPGAVVLVDGYNVARTAWSGLTPEEERSRLIPALEELHARAGAEVVVVFDGQQEGSPVSGRLSRTIRVQFTAAGVSADDVVCDLVDQFPVQRPVVVVSSDREVVDGARARGANSVAARQFLTALGR